VPEVAYSNVLFVRPLARSDAFATASAGLVALAKSEQLNAAFLQQATVLGDAAVTRILGGAAFHPAAPIGFPADEEGAAAGEEEEGEEGEEGEAGEADSG